MGTCIATTDCSDEYGLEPTFEDASKDEGDVYGSFSQWQRHPVYPIGIRMAELATMFYVNGWAQSMFPKFLAWAQTRLPQSPFGNINHSTKFIHEFLPSLAFATQTCVAASLHSIIPALGAFVALTCDRRCQCKWSESLAHYTYLHEHRGRHIMGLVGMPMFGSKSGR